MIDINEYSKYVDKKIIDDILLLAKSLEGLRVLHINSTREGGGVAEILSRLVPLMNSLDIKTDWAVFKGNQQFFKFTKKLHNMLHLPNYDKIDSNEVLIYLGTTYENVNNLDTDNYDVIFVHDPQPLGMVMKKKG
ncbi:MAG: hypothetical protein NZM44_05560 [Candidatus Calescibacterium sp.]|nr:hypothetical protein [Candidatus Calescibacterium sp.]